jgi:succinate-semialdehyde dehydrogenase/glutarate-semialdehyde dehydrogenase
MPKSLEKWREVTPEDRAEIIKAIGKALTNAKIELAQLMTDEMGKTLVQSRQEVGLLLFVNVPLK